MTRLEKLETLIRIDEVIKSYEKQIDLINDTIKHRKNFNKMYPSLDNELTYVFKDEINKCEHNVDIYTRCIVRLNERFRKLVLTLK